jgi:hypothetical protein
MTTVDRRESTMRRATAENAAALLVRKLADRALPAHGKVIFEVTIRGGGFERPRLTLEDSDDEREILTQQ